MRNRRGVLLKVGHAEGGQPLEVVLEGLVRAGLLLQADHVVHLDVAGRDVHLDAVQENVADRDRKSVV